MSKSNDSTEMPTVIEIEPNALELKPGIVMTNLCIFQLLLLCVFVSKLQVVRKIY